VTTKDEDLYFYIGFIVSFTLFTAEIVVNSIVVDEFKYSFFFWLDIIATLSLIPDIRWLIDLLGLVIKASPSYESVNAIPGVVNFFLLKLIISIDCSAVSQLKQDSESH
jgi:hypothetical protein